MVTLDLLEGFRAVGGMKNPAGKGFYNEEGKWTRM